MFPKYRDIAAWATRMADAADARIKRKSSEHRPASFATVKNGLLALEGHINNCISELGGVLSDLYDQKLEAFREWWTVGLSSMREHLENNIEALVKTYNQAAEMRHTEAEKKAARRQNVIMEHIVAMVKYQEFCEKQNTERTAKILEQLSLMNAAYQTDQTLNYNTMIGLFTSLTEQIQSLRKVVDPDDVGEGPTLKWIMSHTDEISQLGADLDRMKSNDVPQNAARVKVIQSIRQLGPFGMLDVRDGLEQVVDGWLKAA